VYAQRNRGSAAEGVSRSELAEPLTPEGRPARVTVLAWSFANLATLESRSALCASER
jgi:hypothetical protein